MGETGRELCLVNAVGCGCFTKVHQHGMSGGRTQLTFVDLSQWLCMQGKHRVSEPEGKTHSAQYHQPSCARYGFGM